MLSVLWFAAALASVAESASVCGGPTVSTLQALSGSPVLIVGVTDPNNTCGRLLAINAENSAVLWTDDGLLSSATVAIALNGRRIVVAQSRAGSQLPALGVIDALTGKVTAPLKDDRSHGLVLTGGDASSLTLAPDGGEVYASLRNGWIAAWDATTGKSLFTQDPPASAGRLDSGRVAIAPSGKLLAVARDTGVYLLRLPPEHAGGDQTFAPVDSHFTGLQLFAPSFSEDGAWFAVEHGYPIESLFFHPPLRQPAATLKDCSGIRWQNADTFACQNSTGAHLRSIRDPQKDIGAAGPVSELPILKVGNSLWVAAYKQTDWKDPSKPLPLTLLELGSGKRVTVTLPGR